MKRPRLFIAAAILFVGGLIGSLVNLLSVYDIVSQVDTKTADVRLDRAELIGNICVAIVMAGMALFVAWVLLVLDEAHQAHAKKPKTTKN